MTQQEKKALAEEILCKVLKRLTDDKYLVDLDGYPCLGIEIHCDALQDLLGEIMREYDDGQPDTTPAS